MSLGPAWCEELLRNWASSDWRDVETQLGMPTVSPTFRGLLEISTEVDTSGYSAAEVQAVAAAVEHLHTKLPEHYRVLARHYRRWARAQLPAKEGDEALLREAVQMVADFVDKTLG